MGRSIRNIAESIYNKINPQYKHIIRTRNSVYDLHHRMDTIERQLAEIRESVTKPQDEELYLVSEIETYRYLYLQRYITGEERVLDLEGRYGAGARLLARFTAIDKCVCVNSIGYYSKMADMLYANNCDNIEYTRGVIYDVKQKYDIITCFDETRNNAIDVEYLRCIHEHLEDGGILAMALTENKEKEIRDEAHLLGLEIEHVMYQNNTCPELLPVKENAAISIIYFRKHA